MRCPDCGKPFNGRVRCAFCGAEIETVPDGGNTPQRIVGLLLHTYHQDLQSGLEISGYTDRASIASATSKKAGDIAILRQDKSVAQCYEVSVKHFGEQRIQECSDSFAIYNSKSDNKVLEVTVLCRPRDVELDGKHSTTGVLLGRSQFGGLIFHFVDIFQWIGLQLVNMSAAARLKFFDRLSEYVSEPNTAEKVKQFWKEYHETQATKAGSAAR